MNKCLKILVYLDSKEQFLKKTVQKYARKHNLEGLGQVMDGGLKIIICGKKEHVDSFVDDLHKETLKLTIKDLIIEPFIKDRDYRGIFRTIE